MRRTGALRPSMALLFSLALPALFLLSGCGNGGKHAASDPGLTFEKLADTTGLSNGDPIVEHFAVSRIPGGSMRVTVRLRLPEGTRVQVAIRRGERLGALAMSQATVEGGEIETPPMMAASGPLPVARYRFELSAQFTPAWQSPELLRATNDGLSLRGAGITRTRIGGTMFWMVEETTI